MARVEHIGAATLYLGDCREVLPTLGKVDAVVTDPPYGQKLNTNPGKGGSKNTHNLKGGAPPMRVRSSPHVKNHASKMWPDKIIGDDLEFDPSLFLTMSPKVLFWGAHKFGHKLPRGRWLLWDKVPTGKLRCQGDGEAAWCSHMPDAPMRIFRFLWDGLSIAGGYESRVERVGAAAVPRAHPTQKPVDLMAWCLSFLDLQPRSIVFDPFMGAGSTGIAALKTGHEFIGIEAEPLYFETACRRIEDAQRQGDMFIAGAA